MKTKGFSIGIIFLVLLVCTTCTKDEALLTPDGESSALKGAKVVFRVQPSGDISGVTDHYNINKALQNAGPGEAVQLAEGLFFLHKSIIRWDFNGTFKGSGMDKTIIQTAPGVLFDVGDCPLLEWSWQTNEGHAILCFPHNSNSEDRTVIVSDLTIIVNEPATTWLTNSTNPGSAYEHNNMQAIVVYYKNLIGMPYYWGDVSLSDKISLNVHYRNISLIGDKDPTIYTGAGYSIGAGLAAFGASSGNFEAKDIYMTNVGDGMDPHLFCGENSTVSIKNCKVENAIMGSYSWVNTNWIIKDNEFKNCSRQALNFDTYKDIYNLPNGSSIIKDNLFNMEDTETAILFGGRMNDVECKDNIFKGNSNLGIVIWKATYWDIKDNDLCDLNVYNPDGFTITLYASTDNMIKDNANQVVGGPSASDPSNYIGEGIECDD